MKDRTEKAAYTMRDELRDLVEEISHVDSPFGAEVVADKLRDILDEFDDEVNAIYIDDVRYWKTPGGHFVSHWTIEPEKDGFQCWYHGEYADWSVLGGQYMRGRSGPTHTTVEEAQQWVEDNRFGKEPVEVLEHSTRVDFRMPDTAPDWFDPADAGEVWHEEDY